MGSIEENLLEELGEQSEMGMVAYLGQESDWGEGWGFTWTDLVSLGQALIHLHSFGYMWPHSVSL